MKRTRLFLLFGITLLLVSSGLLFYGYRLRQTSVTAEPAVQAVTQSQVAADAISGQPIDLKIPSLGYDLPIIDGYYDAKTGAWTLTRDKVQYATLSTLPNDKSGDTFLYGHYRKQVFASLHTIKTGATATITTSNGHTFTYTLVSIRTVDPADSAGVFRSDGAPTLTIQTCTGIFFQNRQLFEFKLSEVH